MKDFLLELFSVLSRLINVLRGGTADMTFSAASHIEGLKSERVIDLVALKVFREQDHCRVWWEWEVERSRQNVLRAAQPDKQKSEGTGMEPKESMVGTAMEFLIVVIAGLGLSMELPVFIACLLLASAGSVLARLFSTPPTRRALAVSLLAGNFVGILFGVTNQHFFSFPPQLAFGVGGVVAVMLLPWLLRRFPALAEGAIFPFIKGGGSHK